MNIEDCHIEDVEVACFRFPTPQPESDGTLTWEATTAVTVRVCGGGHQRLGWTYSDTAAATLIADTLRSVLLGRRCADIESAWTAMRAACRNLGTKGLVMQAVSAVDVALWDLKAKMLDAPLASLFGTVRQRVPIYGSGGFTSESDAGLAEDVAMWAEAGCRAMKIKIGRDRGTRIEWDCRRLTRFRSLAGPDTELMVDANGAYSVAQARRMGSTLDEHRVGWFEEPVTSDDPDGLAVVRSAVECDVTAGEYASDRYDAAGLLGSVDCLQLDATRCGGYTGFVQAAAVARAHNVDVSAHCAPALHVPVAAALPHLRHVEWFTDHVRLEPILLDGVPEAAGGALEVQGERPGHGMQLADRADSYRVGA